MNPQKKYESLRHVEKGIKGSGGKISQKCRFPILFLKRSEFFSHCVQNEPLLFQPVDILICRNVLRKIPKKLIFHIPFLFPETGNRFLRFEKQDQNSGRQPGKKQSESRKTQIESKQNSRHRQQASHNINHHGRKETGQKADVSLQPFQKASLCGHSVILQIKGKNPAKQLHPQMVAHAPGKPLPDLYIDSADHSLQKHCGTISNRTEGKRQKHAVFHPAGGKETPDSGSSTFSFRNTVNIDAENLRKKKRQCRFSRKNQRKCQEFSTVFQNRFPHFCQYSSVFHRFLHAEAS